MAKKRLYTEVLNTENGVNGIEIVTVKTIASGKVQAYKVFNRAWYAGDTPDSLIFALDRLYRTDTRFRLYFGDAQTGEDWLEENDVMGTMGISTGEIQVPLLIPTRRSMGGGAISTDAIVKLTETATGRVLWQHPKYQLPEFVVKERGEDGFPTDLPSEYTTAVFAKGKNYANFKSRAHALAYVAFMRGEQQVLRPLKKAN